MVRRTAIGFLALLSLVFVSGCSPNDKPKLTEVTGTITKNGKPFVDALIEFLPEGEGGASYGTSDASGNFKLNYTTGEPGAAIGKHTVLVTGGRVAGGTAPVATPPPSAPAGGEEFAVMSDPTKGPTRSSGPQPPVTLTAEVTSSGPNTIALTVP